MWREAAARMRSLLDYGKEKKINFNLYVANKKNVGLIYQMTEYI